jgi:hypothetical protein
VQPDRVKFGAVTYRPESAPRPGRFSGRSVPSHARGATSTSFFVVSLFTATTSGAVLVQDLAETSSVADPSATRTGPAEPHASPIVLVSKSASVEAPKKKYTSLDLENFQ